MPKSALGELCEQAVKDAHQEAELFIAAIKAGEIGCGATITWGYMPPYRDFDSYERIYDSHIENVSIACQEWQDTFEKEICDATGWYVVDDEGDFTELHLVCPSKENCPNPEDGWHDNLEPNGEE